jgi:hypothetical protein
MGRIMKLKVNVFIIVFVLLIIIVIGILCTNGTISIQNIIEPTINNTNRQNYSINSINENITIIPIPNTNINSTWPIPSNDYVINHINWSLYPDIQTGYISQSDLSEPNEVINHKFAYAQICVEVKNIDNWNIVNSELSSVAREVRALYGPNSAIDIIGTVNGIIASHVYMLPYDDTVYDPSLE